MNPISIGKFRTTGHILEMIVYYIARRDLDIRGVIRAVQFLLSQLLDDRGHDWAIGPRGHSPSRLALSISAYLGEIPEGCAKSSCKPNRFETILEDSEMQLPAFRTTISMEDIPSDNQLAESTLDVPIDR